MFKFLGRKLILATAALGSGSQAFAQNLFSDRLKIATTNCVSDSFTTRAGETHSFLLRNCTNRGYERVKKIIVSAEGVYRDAQAQVIVNGDVKGTIYAPGSDPSYTITIEDYTDSIQFTALTGTLRVNDIKVVYEVSDREWRRIDEGNRYPVYGSSSRSEASNLALKAINIVSELRGYANYQEYGDFLLPIKKAAARVYARADARSDFSASLRTYLLILLNEIDRAKPYLNDAFERDAAFRLAIELLTVGEKLEAGLR